MLLLQENQDRTLGLSKEICAILRIATEILEEF
jgi:hypothetical protein